MKHYLKSIRGEGYVDTVVLLMAAMLVIALAMKVYPVFIIKNDLNTFVNELVRAAEIEGGVGSKTTSKAAELKVNLGIDPVVKWSRTGAIPLNESFSLTVSQQVDIGFFEFGSFPITLTSKAQGRSEVYYK